MNKQIVTLLALPRAIACAPNEGKGLKDNPFAFGRGLRRRFWQDTCQHIGFAEGAFPSEIPLGTVAENSDGHQFPSWTIRISGPGQITRQTRGRDTDGDELDTVVYLDHRTDGDATWGQNAAKNDEPSWFAALAHRLFRVCRRVSRQGQTVLHGSSWRVRCFSELHGRRLR